MANTLAFQGQGKLIKGTIAVDLPSIASAAVGEVTLTISGAVVGDSVIMNPVAAGNTAGLVFGGARVSAADTVKLRVANLSGGTVDEASQTWDYCLIRA
jgi:hypothetical protein